MDPLHSYCLSPRIMYGGICGFALFYFQAWKAPGPIIHLPDPKRTNAISVFRKRFCRLKDQC